jgi:hypothetical protein
MFSVILMNKKGTEIVGFSIASLTSIVLYIFLLLEILASPKSNDLVVFVFILAILSNIISVIFCLITLIDQKWRYSKKDLPMKLSSDTRSLFNKYKGWMVSENVLLMLLSILFFTLYRSDSNRMISKYNPFFLFQFQKGRELLDISYLIIKLLLCTAVISISFYLFYLGYELTHLINKPLYTTREGEPNNDTDGMMKNSQTNGYTIGNPSILSYFNEMLRNLNLNFLVNYKIYLW